MRPVSLVLSGITRFGADAVRLGLRDVTGLVAVTGPNGTGKTTLLESLIPGALYRQFPSRPQSTLAANCSGPAILDVEIEHGGSTWRALHQVDPTAASGRGKAEAVLFRDGTALSGGRVTDFDEAVAAHFPSLDVVLASVFAAQGGAGSFARLSPGDRRDLLATILGLEELQLMAERATKARRTADAIAGNLAAEYDRAVRGVESAEQLRADQGAQALRVGLLEADAARLAAEEEAAGRVVARLEADAKAADAERERRARLRQRLAGARDRHRALVDLVRKGDAAEARLGALREAVQLLDAIEEERTGLVERYTAATGERKATAAALARARDDAARREAARARLQGARERRTALLGASGRAETARAEAARLEAEWRAVVVPDALERPEDPAALRAELARAEAAATLVGRVPCGGGPFTRHFPREDPAGGSAGTLVDYQRLPDHVESAHGGSCELLRGAQRDLGRLEELRVAVPARELLIQRWAAREIEMKAATALAWEKRGALDTAIYARDAAERDLAELYTLGRQLEGAEEGDADTDAAAIATAQAADDAALNAVAEIGRDGDANRRQRADLATAREDLRMAEIAVGGLGTARESLAAVQTQVAEIEAEEGAILDGDRGDLPGPGPLDDARTALRGARERLEEARAALEAGRERAGVLRGRLEQLGDTVAVRDAVQARRVALDVSRAGWVRLEAGLGREGVQALEIDAAGPELSRLTTELLAAIVGPRWSISLRTIREAEGAKKTREVCELVAIDGLRNRTLPVDQLSGGEQTLVDEALKLAIGVYNAQREGISWGALFRDECDGRLHPEMAARYPEMLRKAAMLGGFPVVYFVTHREELAEQADARIRIDDDGNVTIEDQA